MVIKKTIDLCCRQFVLKQFILIYFLLPFLGNSQTIFYSDVFKGGVTGYGFNPFVLEHTGHLNIHIEPNSTIRKAYLFVTVAKAETTTNVLDNSFVFNGNVFALKWSDAIGDEYNDIVGGHVIKNKTIAFDVTNYISPNINSYTLIPAQNQDPTGAIKGVYFNYYLFVSYENSVLPTVGAQIILNSQNSQQTLIYNTAINADINYNIGFTFNSYAFCQTVWDGSYVLINGNNIGLVGGDEVSDSASCTGIRGAFYYQNNQLFGLDDDTATPFMDGTDALATIENYITNPSNISIQFEYQTPGGASDKTNPVHQLFLAYSSPCTPFDVSVSNDTTVCIGEQVQLNASGGNKYKWEPATGLSCTNCPNPIFTGSSSMVYTVKIWNNDSCSVVRPVRINVNNPQKINCYTFDTYCGTLNGYIKSLSLPKDMDNWYVVTSNNDTLNQSSLSDAFFNLGAGNYSVYYIDTIGCKSEDTIVTINTNYNIVADFTVNPTSGTAPLEVVFVNQSEFATNYNWIINGVSYGSNPNTTFDTAGVYEIGLVAWANDETCADTMWKKIFVYDSLLTYVPNVFTPNDDGANDYFCISVTYPVETHVIIMNRWGNKVHEWNGFLEIGNNEIWNGKSKEGNLVSDGVYFYQITFFNLKGVEKEQQLSGFVHIFKE